MNSSKYSIVIPIKRFTYFWSANGLDQRTSTEYHDNIRRFFEISWETHDKNLRKEDIDCIYFIVASGEEKYLESMIQTRMYNVKTKIIIEHMLIPDKYNFTSHRKQMLLKLLIFKYIQTDLYLILDDDIISLKPFGYHDIFLKNKIRYGSEPGIGSQPYVWECSRDLLKLNKKTNIYRLKKTMSITPEIMITSVVVDMMGYLINMHGSVDNLYNVMSHVSWTEYTLYWLYLKYVDKKGTSYYTSSGLTTENLLEYYKNYTQLLRKIVREKLNYFAIIQSNVYEYDTRILKSILNN
jgi:hypothetical protein